MEPFTMMLGYGLINSLSSLVLRPVADQMFASKRKEEMQHQMETKHELDLDAVRLNKQIELENQINIQSYCHRCRVEEAKNQFDRQLQMWQIGNFNDKIWPLKTPFDHPSLRPQFIEGHALPVNVFLAQTDPRSPFSSLIQPDLKNRLSSFLQATYVNDPLREHPCICRIGDWKDGFQDAAFINALWYGMQGQPTIVINPIQAEFGETLDLNVSIWGLGELGTSPTTQHVLSGSFASAIGKIRREETKAWIERGLPFESKEMAHNMKLLDQEKKMISEGHEEYIGELLSQYKSPAEIQTKIITKFSREYNQLVACVTGMYADIYHMIEYGAQPYMPAAINIYNETTGGNFRIPDIVAQHYRKALTNMVCSNYLQDKLPSTFLGVAKSLSYNPESAREVFQEGVGLWANKKLDIDQEINIPTTVDDCVKLLRDQSNEYDTHYLKQAKDALISMNLPEAAASVDKKIVVLMDKTIRDNQEQQDSQEVSVSLNIIKQDQFSHEDFIKWVEINKNTAIENKARSALMMILREKYIAMMFLDKNDQVIGNIAVQFGIANEYCLSYDKMVENISLFNIKTNQFKISMDKKEFNSFEKLGKSLDKIVNNIRILPDQMRPTKGEKFDISSGQMIKMILDSGSCLEKEVCNVATLDSIIEWITNKKEFISFYDASHAYIAKSHKNNRQFVGVFFTDKEGNALIGDKYPVKVINCETCDSALEALLDGEELGKIKL